MAQRLTQRTKRLSGGTIRSYIQRQSKVRFARHTHAALHTSQLTCASRCTGPGFKFGAAVNSTGKATSSSYPKSISGPSGKR